MTFEEILLKIHEMTQAFDKRFAEGLEELWIELEKLLSELKLLGKRVRPTPENLRLIVQIKAKLSRLIRNKKFNFAINYLTKSLKEIQELNLQYFNQFVNEYTPPEVIDFIRQQSAELVADDLSNTFVNQIKDELTEILLDNVASGGSYNDTRKQILEKIEGKGNDSSKYERYAHSVAVDAINTFSAHNLHLITQDLGFEWHVYQGTLKETSRDFCEAMVAKKWVHVSEYSKVIKGDFKEFKLLGGKINIKTGLPYGMKEDTTPENFQVRAGGHTCNHKLRPTSDDRVPTHVKNEVYSSKEYKEWLKSTGAEPKEELSADELKALRKETLTKTKLKYLNKVVNNSQIGEITFNVTGLKEAINQPHDYLIEKLKILQDSDFLLKHLSETKVRFSVSDKKNRPHISKFHYMPINIGGKKSYIVIMENMNNEKIFYSIVDKIIAAKLP